MKMKHMYHIVQSPSVIMCIEDKESNSNTATPEKNASQSNGKPSQNALEPAQSVNSNDNMDNPKVQSVDSQEHSNTSLEQSKTISPDKQGNHRKKPAELPGSSSEEMSECASHKPSMDKISEGEQHTSDESMSCKPMCENVTSDMNNLSINTSEFPPLEQGPYWPTECTSARNYAGGKSSSALCLVYDRSTGGMNVPDNHNQHSTDTVAASNEPEFSSLVQFQPVPGMPCNTLPEENENTRATQFPSLPAPCSSAEGIPSTRKELQNHKGVQCSLGQEQSYSQETNRQKKQCHSSHVMNQSVGNPSAYENTKGECEKSKCGGRNNNQGARPKTTSSGLPGPSGSHEQRAEPKVKINENPIREAKREKNTLLKSSSTVQPKPGCGPSNQKRTHRQKGKPRKYRLIVIAPMELPTRILNLIRSPKDICIYKIMPTADKYNFSKFINNDIWFIITRHTNEQNLEIWLKVIQEEVNKRTVPQTELMGGVKHDGTVKLILHGIQQSELPGSLQDLDYINIDDDEGWKNLIQSIERYYVKKQ